MSLLLLFHMGTPEVEDECWDFDGVSSYIYAGVGTVTYAGLSTFTYAGCD